MWLGDAMEPGRQPFGPPETRQKRLTLIYRPTCLWVSHVWDWDCHVTCHMNWHLLCVKLNHNLLVKSWMHDLKSGFIISKHEHMIWNQDLLYQIMNALFEIRIHYIKSGMHDLKSGFIISNHECMIWFSLSLSLAPGDGKERTLGTRLEHMIWNQDLLSQIINLWFEIRINYIKS